MASKGMGETRIDMDPDLLPPAQCAGDRVLGVLRNKRVVAGQVQHQRRLQVIGFVKASALSTFPTSPPSALSWRTGTSRSMC